MTGPAADSARVVIVPADRSWAKRAARAAAELADSLGAAALRIDHIGSTAIPDMPAKDVLDLQVSVAEIDDADSFSGQLLRLGYTHEPQICMTTCRLA